MTAFKAQAMAQDLSARLSAMIPSLTISETYDANFNPILYCSNGSESLFITIAVEPDPSGGVDGLNLTQTIYSPHQITMLRDSTISSLSMREICVSESARSGCKLLIYEVHPLPASYTLTGATEVASIPSNAWNPLTLSE